MGHSTSLVSEVPSGFVPFPPQLTAKFELPVKVTVLATSWVQPTSDGGYTFDKRTLTGNPERIDYQWTRGMTVSEMFVVKTRRSDHHVVVADYKVP